MSMLESKFQHIQYLVPYLFYGLDIQPRKHINHMRFLTLCLYLLQPRGQVIYLLLHHQQDSIIVCLYFKNRFINSFCNLFDVLVVIRIVTLAGAQILCRAQIG